MAWLHCSYDNAYGGLAIPEFLGVLVVPSLLWFDPLELSEDEGVAHTVHDLPWFETLKRFCDTTTNQRDVSVLPRLVQKTVIPFVNVARGW